MEPVYNGTIFNSTVKVQLYGFFSVLSFQHISFGVPAYRRTPTPCEEHWRRLPVRCVPARLIETADDDVESSGARNERQPGLQ